MADNPELVSVFVRVRPPLPNSDTFLEDGAASAGRSFDLPTSVNAETGALEVTYPRPSVSDRNAMSTLSFSCTRALDPTCSQMQLYETCVQGGVRSALASSRGYLCLAYGQTAAGKTYTCTGGGRFHDRGLVQRVVSQIYAYADACAALEGLSVRVCLSVLQVYGEAVYDLLQAAAGQAGPVAGKQVSVQEGKDGRLVLPGAVSVECGTEQAALRALLPAAAARATAGTAANAASSRSHALYTFTVETLDEVCRGAAGPPVRRSVLTVADLAGSERQGTGAGGLGAGDPWFAHGREVAAAARGSEGRAINLSLHHLESCMLALRTPAPGPGSAPAPASSSSTTFSTSAAQQQSHVPFRSCTLTLLLRDHLCPPPGLRPSACALIACVSPEAAHVGETLSTVRFAARCAQVELHTRAVRRRRSRPAPHTTTDTGAGAGGKSRQVAADGGPGRSSGCRTGAARPAPATTIPHHHTQPASTTVSTLPPAAVPTRRPSLPLPLSLSLAMAMEGVQGQGAEQVLGMLPAVEVVQGQAPVSPACCADHVEVEPEALADQAAEGVQHQQQEEEEEEPEEGDEGEGTTAQAGRDENTPSPATGVRKAPRVSLAGTTSSVGDHPLLLGARSPNVVLLSQPSPSTHTHTPGPTTAAAAGSASSACALPHRLSQPTRFLKYPHRAPPAPWGSKGGGAPQERWVWVEQGGQGPTATPCLCWSHAAPGGGKGKVTRHSLGEVMAITRGCGTPTLKRAHALPVAGGNKSSSTSAGSAVVDPSALCFSLLLPARTIDLQAASSAQREQWVQALGSLLSLPC